MFVSMLLTNDTCLLHDGNEGQCIDRTERERERAGIRIIMAAAAVAVIGVSSGGTGTGKKKSLLTSCHLHSHSQDHTKNHLLTPKSSSDSDPHIHRPSPIIKAFQQHEHLSHSHSHSDLESSSLEALLLLHRSILENQWNLSSPQPNVVSSGISARKRRRCRRNMRKYVTSSNDDDIGSTSYLLGKSYVKGVLIQELLTHAQVVHLSKKIKAGLFLQDYKSKLKKIVGYDPSDDQLAASLRISRTELQSKSIECSLAREKLAMSNVRLVMSIAQKYDNMGAEMPDLIQGGLIGLLRGIEKFDSSKGFKISTYVYWWIRQGVSRALVDSSRTLRLPTHLHERLGLIRNAKLRLEEKGISPSIERLAECLNMSPKKVRNATEAVSKVFSLDREAFPSLNGLPGETLHSYIADNRLENNPWHGVGQWTLKDEVNNLMKTTLCKREQDIVRLYYGMDKECLTWEDISKRIGLSRERVRQVGLVALEKLKYAARRRRLEAMLVKQ